MNTVAQQEQINGLGRDSKRITVGVIITTKKERKKERERDRDDVRTRVCVRRG